MAEDRGLEPRREIPAVFKTAALPIRLVLHELCVALGNDSFEMKIIILYYFINDFKTIHIGFKYRWDGYGAVGVLVIFHYGYYGASQGEA